MAMSREGTARLDERRLRSHGLDPAPNRLGDELRAVVRPNMAGHAPKDEQIGQDIDHGGRVRLPVDPDGQAFAGELVDDIEHAERPPVMGPALDEVAGSRCPAGHCAAMSREGDVVRTLGPETDAGPLVQPEPALPGLLLRHLQPLPPPYPLDTLHVLRPPGIPETGRDPAMAVAPILAGQRDDVRGQRLLVSPPARCLPPGRAMLAQHATGETLRDSELLPDVIDAGPAAGGAWKFPEAFGLGPHPEGSASQASDRRRPCAAARSPSAASPGRSSARRTPCATDGG